MRSPPALAGSVIVENYLGEHSVSTTSTAPRPPATLASLRAPAKVPGPTVNRHIRGLVALAVVASVLVVLRTHGLLQGLPALALAVLLVLMVPSARNLSQRLLYNGLITLGAVPLTWWVPERFLGVDHGTLLLAAVAGLIAGWIAAGKSPRRRALRLLPRVRAIDSLPFLAGILSASSLGVMLSVRSPLEALAIMTSRWDYQSHFSIYHMIRSHGEVIPTIPPGAVGELWGFAEYPQGFHALIATLSNLYRPGEAGVDSEVISYIVLQAAVCSLTVLLVVAGLCALPAVRRRAAIAAPGIAVAAAAWIYGPGAIPVYGGFGNFYMACGMATATVLALLTVQRRLPVIAVAVVGAGLVGICNNWLLLVSLVMVIIITKLWDVARNPGAYGLSWWLLAAGCGIVTLIGIALPLVQLIPLIRSSQGILEALGGIVVPDLGQALLVLTLVVVLGFANLSASARTGSRFLRAERLDVAKASLGLLVPVAVGIYLAVTQSMQHASLTYYFYKYLIAVLLLAWPLAVAAAAALIPPPALGSARRRNIGMAAGLSIVAVAATQAFGFSLPDLDKAGLPATVRPVGEMTVQKALLASVPGYVPRLLRSATQQQPDSTLYVPAPGTMDPVLAARWQWGMRAKSSSTTTNLGWLVYEITKDYARAPEVIARILNENPDMSVIVDAELYTPVHAHLSTLGLEGRLIRLA